MRDPRRVYLHPNQGLSPTQDLLAQSAATTPPPHAGVDGRVRRRPADSRAPCGRQRRRSSRTDSDAELF